MISLILFSLALISQSGEASQLDSLLDNHELAYSIMRAHSQWTVQESYQSSAENMSESVLFYLYTRKNPNDTQQIWIDDMVSIKQSNFDSSKPTFFVIHGYMNSINSDAIQLPMKNLIQIYDCNVIGVDWSNIAVTLLYNVAASETVNVGEYLGEMIKFMADRAELDTTRTHLIGHSLGAHVAGFAGKTYKPLGRITGLDPAMPGFTDVNATQRLDGTDALFVDCIHTCAGELGMMDSVCQADFYVNGGTDPQPGCGIDLIGTCSHGRSYQLFSESVLPTHLFHATKCKSVPNYNGKSCVKSPALMGEPASQKYPGIFYVKTKGKYPFSRDSKNSMRFSA